MKKEKIFNEIFQQQKNVYTMHSNSSAKEVVI